MMNRSVNYYFLITLFLSSSLLAQESPDAFFQRFISLEKNDDPALASLYSDDAKIFLQQIYPSGRQKLFQFHGWFWKGVLTQLSELEPLEHPAYYLYTDIVTTKTKHLYTITANRYSVHTCNTDTTFYTILAPDGNGSFFIVEQGSETKIQPRCNDAKT